MWRDITQNDRQAFNKLALHPFQSYEWGEFREKFGTKVLRKGLFAGEKLTQAFQLTVHPIPYTPWNIGYLPRGKLPTKELIEELEKIGKEHQCIFIQQEPYVPFTSHSQFQATELGLRHAAHPQFAKHTVEFDLTKSDEELLKAMHSRARYDINLAQKRGIVVEEINTDDAIDIFWPLMQETMKRKHFYSHSKEYYKTQWASLPHTISENTPSLHLLCAKYLNKPLTAWIFLVFNKKLFAPFGASSQEHNNLQHTSLVVWKGICFGKKYQLITFDLGTVAAPNAPPSDPYFGVTRFKKSFGPKRIEYIGSYDLVFSPLLYRGYKFMDKLRWWYLNKVK